MWQTQILGFSLYQLVWFFVLYSFFDLLFFRIG